ncbi:MAG: NlpC/P60 family protein [Cellulosilyticaceae bacterium]
MTVKRIIGMTLLATVAMSQTVMAEPIETETELTEVLQTISTSYIEQPVIEADKTVQEERADKGTLTKIIVDEAKVRDQASEDGDIIKYLSKEDEIFAIEMIDNWYLVQIDDVEGYIYKTQVDELPLATIPYTRTEANQLVVEEDAEESIPEKTYLGEEVVSYAKQFLGNPYVYGGNSLTRGVDCSGFTSQVYKNFGIELQRSSRSQYASNGYKVSKSDLLPGDLVFYGFNGHIDHVAIYAGEGEIVHASTAKTGIKMSELEYGKPIIGIKRVIK